MSEFTTVQETAKPMIPNSYTYIPCLLYRHVERVLVLGYIIGCVGICYVGIGCFSIGCVGIEGTSYRDMSV